MNEIIINLLKALYTSDKESVLKFWQELDDFLEKEEINDQNYMDIFQYLILCQSLGACLGKDTSAIKNKITVCIKQLLLIQEYKDNLEKFLKQYSEDKEGNAKKEMDAFKNLSETGFCDDVRHYGFALYYLSFFLFKQNDEKCLLNIDPIFRSIISFAAWYTQNPGNLETHISDYVLGFFYEYCEQETLSKRYFYTDKTAIETRLNDLCQRDPEKFSSIMKNHNFDEVYDWVHLYGLFENNERSYSLLRLFDKVFLNKSVIVQSGDKDNDEIDYFNSLMPDGKFINYYSDHAYESAPQLFDQVRTYITDLEKYPGFVIMLYMLCKEFSLDQFYIVFPDRKTYEMNSLEQYEWKMIPEVLADHYENRGKNKSYDELFKSYEKYLLNLESKVAKDFSIIDSKRGEQFNDNNELLNMLLYFCVWENVSYCMKDNNDFNYDVREAHKTQLLSIPFFNACEFNSWRKEDEIEKIFNNIAEIFCFENPSHTFDGFKIETDKSNLSLVLLLYNLSRTEVEAQAAMKDQINYLREIQRKKLPLERSRSNLNQAKYNQDKINSIDKGFKLNGFITQVFPFCGVEFSEYFKNPDLFMLRRDYTCKFICETDTVYYKDKETVTDFRETNRLGFKTRYLYKDRNMSTHHVRHASVDSLMKTSNWRNLLYAFCDIEKNLLELLDEKQRNYYAHPLENLKPEINPQMFVIYYLLKENNHLYNEFISKLYKTADLIQIESEFKLYCYDPENDSFQDKTENVIKKIESTFDLTDEKTTKKSNDDFIKKLSYEPEELNCDSCDILQQRENLFQLRLEELLNIMFAANGSNENGFEHNLTMYDFFKRYHAEIAIYLVYLTWKFSNL